MQWGIRVRLGPHGRFLNPYLARLIGARGTTPSGAECELDRNDTDLLRGTLINAMTNLSKRSRQQGGKAHAPTAEPAVDDRPADAPDAISPQDFYREMVARPDVRAILARLAQVDDGHA